MLQPLPTWLIAASSLVAAMTVSSSANAGDKAVTPHANAASKSLDGRVIQKPIVPADKLAKNPVKKVIKAK